MARDNNDVSIRFAPSKREGNVWKITVKRESRKGHQAPVEGANILAYHEKLVRINLYDLVNGEKNAFELKEVWRQQMEALEREMVDEAYTFR